MATAALTNVALLLVMYPEVVEMLEQVVIMGGCLGLGNTGAAAVTLAPRFSCCSRNCSGRR